MSNSIPSNIVLNAFTQNGVKGTQSAIEAIVQQQTGKPLYLAGPAASTSLANAMQNYGNLITQNVMDHNTTPLQQNTNEARFNDLLGLECMVSPKNAAQFTPYSVSGPDSAIYAGATIIGSGTKGGGGVDAPVASGLQAFFSTNPYHQQGYNFKIIAAESGSVTPLAITQY